MARKHKTIEKNKVRMGVIGVGGMGAGHARAFQAGRVPRAVLAAVCDADPARLAAFEGVPGYTDSRKLIRSGEVDAVLVATPHYAHTTVGIDALRSGIHTLLEKPISVHKADAERLIEACPDRGPVFAAMFNQRTNPLYIKTRDLVRSGELGKVQRASWIITNWFRSDAYYASGDWRATWAGEGGGALLNQCPHQLDLLQWILGMPTRVHAFCRFGHYHDIEVEDDVTAYLEYENGASATFITSTAEAPGTNRFEIAGTRGRAVIEEGRILFLRNTVDAAEYCRTTSNRFGVPEHWKVEIPVEGKGGQHQAIRENFVEAILDGAPLIAPAEEGIHSVELGNAMLLSTFQGRAVDVPISAQTFARHLKKRCAASRYKPGRAGVAAAVDDLGGSFGKA